MSFQTVKFADAPLDIVDGDRGKNYPKQDEFFDDGYCLFLNTGNVTTDGFNFSNCQFINESKDNLLRKGKLKRNDVIMTTRGTIGNTAFFNDNVPFENIRINSGMVIFRPDANKLRPDFLYQYLRSSKFTKQVNTLRSGAAQPQLPIRDIKTIDIPVPDLPTQERIAEVLSAYDDLIENNRRRIRLLEESARLLYREWFVHFRFPGHEHIPRTPSGLPEGWEEGTAFDFMDVLSGGTPKTTVPDYWDGDIPFFTPKDCSDHAYVFQTLKTVTEAGLNKCNSKLYPKNTLFITARGTVGNLNLAMVPMAMNQSCYALVAKKPLTQFFLFLSLQATIQQFKSRAVGAVFDAIIVDTFKNIPFILPAESLINEFDIMITPTFEQISTLASMNNKLAAARDILLPRLMNGEVAV